MKTFNINNDILIHITKYGWEIINKKYDPEYIQVCISPKRVTHEGETYYRFQLHVVMEMFGSSMTQSFPTPFESTILIPE